MHCDTRMCRSEVPQCDYHRQCGRDCGDHPAHRGHRRDDLHRLESGVSFQLEPYSTGNVTFAPLLWLTFAPLLWLTFAPLLWLTFAPLL